MQLPPGAQGNFKTLKIMAQFVREDSEEKDIGAFVKREIIGLEKQTLSDQISAAFYYCRDQIHYEPEQEGFETIADLWSCLYALNPLRAVGDCAVKVVALATCLSFLDLKPRFVAIRQIPNVDFFHHVYISVEINRVETVLDPTPAQFRVGDELSSIEKVYFRIF